MKKSILKILILLSTLYAVIMLAHWPIGFTLFTQLSNLFVAAVVLAQLIRPDGRLAPVKFTATVSISVTFGVYLAVLAPMAPGGFFAAYAEDHCASLCLHAITPLLTVADFLLHDAPGHAWPKRDAPIAVLPPLAYFLFILILGRRGVRWWGMAAPYMFLNYDSPVGWFGFDLAATSLRTPGVGVFYVALAMVGVFWLVGLALLALARRRNTVKMLFR